ncbi:3-dehydroquinate synthase [Prochlorococcus sp. MIT 0602]|nr:3-dehydroquinate synthase [Prochlorococcus sp. MIT 0602]
MVIGSNNLNSIGIELEYIGVKKGTRILVVTNSEIAKPYSSLFIQSLKSAGYLPYLFIVEAGEEQKRISTIELIHNAAYENQIERSSLIIALGGGVIGDMAGFAASTWLRGISFIQVPTTLLAMVDASIGGKTGVNHPQGKNLIGAFHQPSLVLIDINTLKTLPEREFRSGMAEVIKYGVIKDKELFCKLEQINNLQSFNRINNKDLHEIITSSAKTKARIVELDERESGIRAILNYGHTFGHVVETLCGYGNWLHGEAVSIGMIAIGHLAIQKSFWDAKSFIRQKELLLKAGLPISWPTINHQSVLRSLKGDKKVKDGNLRFILPKTIGEAIISSEITTKDIEVLLKKLDN